LSPILFNIVADMLATLFTRATEENQFKGIVPHLILGGLSILQYADDTMVFLDHNLEHARNIKLILTLFEQMPGLKINFHKSELFCYELAKEYNLHYSLIFGCGIGSMPFKYLGIPMTHRRLRNSDWQGIIDRFEKRLITWKAKFLSSGGRWVLINSVLSSLPIFMMSFFEIWAGVLKKLNVIRSRFFWQRGSSKTRYRLARWHIVCQPKALGGLGVSNLAVKNISLLSKWLFKLLNEEGRWRQLLKNKYLEDKSLTQISRRPDDSHFWSGLMIIKDQFLRWGHFQVRNGHATRFWNDTSRPLSEQFSNLFNIVRNKSALVVDIFSDTNFNLSFCRTIRGIKMVEWHNLLNLLTTVTLNPARDNFVWDGHKNEIFSVQSMYHLLIHSSSL
jgi:hypothetical protein